MFHHHIVTGPPALVENVNISLFSVMEIQSVNTTGEYEIQTVANLQEYVEENVEENNTGVPLEIEDPLNT